MSDRAAERSTALSQVVKILALDLFDHAREALLSLAPFVCIVGGRRSAKSHTSMVAAILCAFTRRNVQVLVTGPNEASIRRYLQELNALLAPSELARSSTLDAEAMLLRFTNGSEIIGVPPTAGRLRGYGSRVWMVVVDEAGYCPASVWEDVRYTLLDHQAEGAQAWLIGSPWGGDEHFFKQMWKLGMNGDADAQSFQWRTSMNPLLSPGWEARERTRINSLEAAQQLDGEWWSDQSQFYPSSLMMPNVASIELPPLAKLHGPARGILSMDWGVSYDQSVAFVLYRLAGVSGLNPDAERLPRFVGYPYVFEPATPLRDVVDQAVDSPAIFQYYAGETNGVGAMPSQELGRRITKGRPLRKGETRTWFLNATTSQTKMASHALMRWLLEQRQLVLPRDPVLLRQFAGMNLDTSSRTGSIEAGDPATHDDVVDAAAMAMLPYVPNGAKRVVCVVQELAGEKAVPESPVEPLDVPVVETGDGLKLYERPVLQSVRDQRFTMPDGAGPAVYRDTQYDDVREQVRERLQTPSETE
jgi:hypothetical protein